MERSDKMKIATKILILFLTLNLLSCRGSAQETETKEPKTEIEFSETKKSTFPKPIGIINDYGKVFSELQRTELSKVLYDYEIETTRQIVIVTIDSIKPYQNIQKYAVDVGNEWGIGNAEKNNGLTIVVCNPCRQIGIATGTETELILTDEICKNIIDQTIIPEFKNGKFYDGIKNGIVELIKKWK
ncbi:TPM domain-containing protein [uncultured Winogradskyella sp.]|uniref:TPM domain-containing protein n=1 Tax=uncultured Winogradskyella sp. TaxID=395353 RepID=UPI0030EB78FB|tara:strand:+ start:8429 stop:8986 length:558 start_codon:yes stop_codon:yes gene_type:complete